MTSKEKAKELLEKFIVPTRVPIIKFIGVEYIDSSKQCALIAVDELIESFNSIYDASIRNIEKYSGAQYGMRDYWESVKHEIEKL